MNILLGFLPFIAFAILSGPLGATAALAAGAIVSAGLILRGRFQHRSVKILEAGTLVLFLALAVYSAMAGENLSLLAVRLCVDLGLLAITLVSMAIGQPFTVQYAREQVAPEYWNTPRFVRTNYVITAGWAAAFLVISAIEAALLYLPDLPRPLGILAIVATLFGAVRFTENRAKAAQ